MLNSLTLAQTRSEQTCGYATVPLLRAYKNDGGDHFYTTNPLELEQAIRNLGYNSEGDTADVFTSQVPLTIPLYRLYSSGAVDHFYTTDAAERDRAIDNLDALMTRYARDILHEIPAD